MAENGGDPYYSVRGLETWGICVPRTVPVEMAARIVAAVLSYEGGTARVDYQLKRWRAKIEAVLSPQAVLPSRPIGLHPVSGEWMNGQR